MKTCKIVVHELSQIKESNPNLVLYGFRDFEDEKRYPQLYPDLIRILVDEPNEFSGGYLFIDQYTGVSSGGNFRTDPDELFSLSAGNNRAKNT